VFTSAFKSLGWRERVQVKAYHSTVKSVIQLGRVSTAPQSKPASYTEQTNSSSAKALLFSKKRTTSSRLIQNVGLESASSLLIEKYSSLVGELFANEESARAA
jgi:hypothetical protein